MAYDAGSAFLQIIPSFRGIEKNLQQGVRSMAATLRSGVGDAFTDGIRDGGDALEKESRSQGHRSARAYNGALNEELRKTARKTAELLPDINLKLNPTEFDRVLDERRKRLLEIADKTIDIDFNGQEILSELLLIREELKDVQREAKKGIDVPINAGRAADALKPLEGIEREAERKGREAGGAYSTAFNSAAKSARLKLGDIDATGASAEVKGVVEELRLELDREGDLQVGVSVDEKDAAASMRQTLAQLEALAKDESVTEQLQFDAGKAAADLRGFFAATEDQADEAGRASGRKFIGAYATEIKSSAKAASEAIGDIELGVDSTQVHLEIAVLSEELHNISGRVGIDLDTDTAKRRIEEIVAEIKALQVQAGEDHELVYNLKLSGDILGKVAALDKDLIAQADSAGGKAGDKFGSSFVRDVKKIIDAAQGLIGDVNVEVDVDASPAEVKLAVLKGELKDLDTHLELGTDPTLVLAALRRVEAEVKKVKAEAIGAGDIKGRYDATGVEQALAQTRELQIKAKRAGDAAGGKFAEGFQDTVRTSLSALPEVTIDGDSTELDKVLADARGKLLALSHVRIGIDADIHEVTARVAEVELLLKRLEKESPKVEIRADAQDALKPLAAHQDRVNTLTGAGQPDEAKAGADDAGAYVTGFRTALTAAAKSLPKLDVTGDLSESQRELAQIRAELEELSGKRVGVDIDDRDATDKLKELHARLFALGSKDEAVDVRVNSEAALVEIGRFYDKAGDGAGPLAAKIRTALSAAVANVPAVDVGADITPAQAQLTLLARQLETIRSQHIDMELDDSQATVEIARLKEKLVSLARTSPDVDVKVNALRAIASLKEIETQANSTDESINNVGSGSGQGIGRLAALVAAGASLGTILVPAAAAATAAIAGIGTAAGAALAGVGVFALGIFGLGTAIQALDAYSTSQAKTAKSLGASNKALATATDQVKTATDSLADAKANAADAEISSAEQVKSARQSLSNATQTAYDNNIQASRDLKDAQDSEKDSRKALNDAINDAKVDMLSVSLQVEKNALSQRQSVLAVKQAKLQLDAVLSNPAATKDQRTAAQIAYDEQVVQFKTLQNDGRQLGEQQKAYAEKGVNGSDKVVAARKAEVKSQQAVGDAAKKVSQTQTAGEQSVASAKQAVSDAERAQVKSARSSAKAIASAQQQVIAANRATQQAITASASAGGSALDNLNTALANLSPSGQNFAKFIFGLKSNFLELTGEVQQNMLPGIQSAINAVLQDFGPIKDFVGRVATTIGAMFSDLGKVIKLPVFKELFNYFSTTAVPTLHTLGTIALNVTTAFANLFLAVTPLSGGFLNGLVSATAKFAAFAAKFTTTSGYVEFLKYVSAASPAVLAFLKSTATLIGHIVVAAAPLGLFVTKTLTGLFNELNKIGSVKLTLLLGALAVLTAAFLLVGGAIAAVTKIKTVGAPFITFAKYVKTSYVSGIDTAIARTEALNAEVAVTGATATSSLAKLNPFQRFFSQTLPGATRATTTGLTNAANAVGDLRTNSVKAGTTLSGIAKGSLLDFSGGLGGGAKEAENFSTGLTNLSNRSLGDVRTSLGTTASLLSGNYSTSAGAAKTATRELSAEMEALKDIKIQSSLSDLEKFMGAQLSPTLGTTATETENLAGKVGGLSRGAKLAAGASGLLSSALGGLLSPGLLITGGILAVVSVLGALKAKQEEAKQKTNELADSLLALGAAYKSTGSVSSTAVTDVVNNNKDLQKAVLNSGQYGIDVSTIGQAVSPGADSATRNQKQGVVLNELDTKTASSKAQLQSLNNALDVQSQLGQGGSKQSEALQKQADALKSNIDGQVQLRASLVSTFGQINANTKVTDLLSNAYDNQAEAENLKNIPADARRAASLSAIQGKIDTLTTYINNQALGAQGALANKQLAAADVAQFYTTQLQKQLTAQDQLQTSNTDFATGLANLKSQVDGNVAAHDKSAKSLAFNSTNLEKNTATALANRTAVAALAKANNDAFIADLQNNVSVKDATKAYDARVTSLKKEAKQLGLNAGQTDALIKSQGNIHDIKQKYETPGFADAFEQLRRLQFLQSEISNKPGITEKQAEADYKTFLQGQKNKAADATNPFNYQYQSDLVSGQSKASGGPIYGAGTKTSDSVPIWASAGEFMQQAAAVDYYGEPFMHALNRRQIPKQILGFAEGGLIGDLQRLASGGTIVAKPFKIPTALDTSALALNVQSQFDANAAVPVGGVATGSVDVAETAEKTARALKATTKQLVALIEAGIVESGLENLTFGDRDSLGFLQQRANWGTRAQRLNVATATAKFIEKAKRVDGADLNPGQLAQKVQVSAFPDRYEKQLANAYAVLNRNPPYVGVANAAGTASDGTTNPLFGAWPSSPAVDHGHDSGVWRKIIQYVAPTGLDRKSYGTLYQNRRTDNGNWSWHSDGRAVDFGGYNQDALAKFFLARRPSVLELIHSSETANYGIKRGQPHDMGHEYALHKNHVHVAMAAGGPVPKYDVFGDVVEENLDKVTMAKFRAAAAVDSAGTYDAGGWIKPGVTAVLNASNKPEAVFSHRQFQDIKSIAELARGGAQQLGGNTYHQYDFGTSTLDASRLQAVQARSDALTRIHRPNY